MQRSVNPSPWLAIDVVRGTASWRRHAAGRHSEELGLGMLLSPARAARFSACLLPNPGYPIDMRIWMAYDQEIRSRSSGGFTWSKSSAESRLWDSKFDMILTALLRP